MFSIQFCRPCRCLIWDFAVSFCVFLFFLFLKSYDAIGIGKTLLTIEGNELRLFEAVDDDAGIFGDVTFQMTSSNDDSLHFEMVKLNRKQSQLKTTRIIQERSYTVNNLINFYLTHYPSEKTYYVFHFKRLFVI